MNNSLISFLQRPSYPVELLHVAQTGTIRNPLAEADEPKSVPGKDLETDQTEIVENPYTVIDKKTEATTDFDLQLTAVTADDQL